MKAPAQTKESLTNWFILKTGPTPTLEMCQENIFTILSSGLPEHVFTDVPRLTDCSVK